MGPIGSSTNIQKMKLGIQKVQMDGHIIGYVRISDNPLTSPQAAIYTQFGSKKLALVNFTRIM